MEQEYYDFRSDLKRESNEQHSWANIPATLVRRKCTSANCSSSRFLEVTEEELQEI